MSHLIVISNENQLESINGDNYDNYIIIVTKKFLKDKCTLSFPNAKISWYGDILTEYKSWQECLAYEKEIFEKINDIQINGKNVFKDTLGYNGHSLLDIDAVKYLSAHINMIANLYYKISIIESIITKLKPDIVLLCSPYSEWEEIVKYICEKNNIKLNTEKNYLKMYIEKIKSNLDVISLLNTLRLLPFALKLKNLYLAIKNYLYPFKNENKHEILLFSINTKYSDILVPLFKCLKNDKFNPLILLPSESNYFNLLNKEKLDYTILDSYLDISIFLSINSIYNRINNNYNKIKGNEEFISTLEDICDPFIANKLIKEIDYTIMFSMYSLKNIFIIKKILKKYSSKLLFSTHFSENIVNSLFIGCKESEIPTIGLHRGTSIWQPEHTIFNGDKLLVSGEQSNKIFTSMGIDPHKIAITGFPIFDNLLKKLNDRTSIECKIREKFDITSDYIIITYLTQSFGARFDSDDRKKEIEMVFNAITEFKDVFLIIKLHPTECDTTIYENIAKNLGIKNLIITQDDLDNILLSSKIALTKNSTAGFNALIANCKLITLNSSDDENNFFLDANIAKNAESTEELIDNITKLKEESNRNFNLNVKEFIEYHFYKLDCNSINRIRKMIYSILK